jgi:type I restriction enzyme R subunit
MLTEADTCTRFVVPKLKEAGWDNQPHAFREQHSFTDGRIVVAGQTWRRKARKRADYLLDYTRDFTIAVVEAKMESESAGAGMQQAKEYADMLGLKFAYATNGHQIIEFDYLAGTEREIDAFPSPQSLWDRLRAASGLQPGAIASVLEPFNLQSGKIPRYYQQIAISRAVQAIASGQQRVLLTMATGTGKTLVAFQVCWMLWNSRWNRTGAYRRPKILFLADRNVLVDDPKDKTFALFGDARFKIENGKINKGREMYFAIYQAIAKDANRPGLYREYPPDFFDLIIVDECHRGSASDDSNWREILDYFEPAAKLGMTATPKRDDNVNTYAYFGDPIYTYSLRQGIEDGFLAPYRVHRVVTSVDAAGWRPDAGVLDRFGRPIPDGDYQTRDFERAVSLKKRTEAIAAHLTQFLKSSGRMGKTMVFCVDQEHADDMRRALVNLNSDLVRQYPDYVCRVTSDEHEIGRGHLDRFMDPEEPTPVILTTSQMLTTGVDAPTCKNVVLVRVINSPTEFKQIIGRGTRVLEGAGKMYFNIIDYTGSATRQFADPDFDGDPIDTTTTPIDNDGNQTDPSQVQPGPTSEEDAADAETVTGDQQPTDTANTPRKFYFDGGQVEISAHLVYELDADGKQLRVVKFTEYTREKVRTLYTSADELRRKWSNPQERKLIIEQLEERGICFDELATSSGHPEADPFDLLCHVAFGAPMRTRRERAQRLKQDRQDFFDRYGPEARKVLQGLVDKYEQYGSAQFVLPDALQVPPISDIGNVAEIASLFGGAENLRLAVSDLQQYLYA